MDGTGLDAWIPAWAQSALVAGGVIAGMIGWVYRAAKGSSYSGAPEANVTRNDFIEVFKSETRENRDVLFFNRDTLLAIRDATQATRDGVARLIAVNEDIARRFQAEANDARAAEIAERVARQFRDKVDRLDRNRHDHARDDE